MNRPLQHTFPHKLRFLFLVTKYPVEVGDTYMTSELAGELRNRGHDVSVMHLNWDACLGGTTRNYKGIHGEDIIEIAPRAITLLGKLILRISKFLMSTRHARTEMKLYLDLSSFDATVTWTPALIMDQPLQAAIAGGCENNILWIFDFFPIHHMEIGLVPRGPIFRSALKLEERTLRKFSAIICNLPGNINYLRKNYRLSARVPVLSTPLWSDVSTPKLSCRNDVRKANDLPKDRPIAIFGGQITEGRGIEYMLEAAAIAERDTSDLIFLFVGNGRLAKLVAEKAKQSNNIVYLPGMIREDYMQIVSACDVGMVATVEGVSSYSFPTKTIDYLRAGLPVVAAVEEDSDYLDILSDYNVGAGASLNDPKQFYETALNLATRSLEDGFNGDFTKKCLEEIFHVRHAADTLLNAVQSSKS